MSVLYFLVLVGGLVAIHEFGHFLAAKLLDFKVTRFSIGFGQPLVRVRGRETEYQIALVPLGGYVRILGEDPADEVDPADAHRSFSRKPLWQRLIVVLAGPAANLLLPVVIYFVAFAGHTELPAAVVGDVLSGSPAARAGFQPGDRIASIDGEPVRYWEDVEAAVSHHAGNEMRFGLRRGSHEIERDVAPVESVVRARDGSVTRSGWIGITQAPYPPQVGVLEPTSPAARAGLRTGDVIVSVDGREIGTWTELRQVLAGRPRRMTLTYLRAQPVGRMGVFVYRARQTVLVPDETFGPDGAAHIEHGLYPADLFVSRVQPGSPAARAGLRPGDLLTRVDGEPIQHWLVLASRLRSRPGHAFVISWRRAGRASEMKAAIRQTWTERRDEYGHDSDVLVFGAEPSFDRGRGQMVPIDGRIRYAAKRSVDRTLETIGVMASGLGSILRGKSPREDLGGPITMFQVAAVSGSHGWGTFFLMLALVSVSVGLINLLPVPVLDGGHILMFAIESVRRRPLSARSRDLVTLCGLAIVGLITILALGNDVVRYLL